MTTTPSLESTELVCWKVAGGNMRIQRAVSIPGLRGVLYSFPHHSERGGDLHYLSACGSGAVARMCIADVTGHGEEVAEFSGWLEEAFSAHIHRASPAGVLRAVNKRAAQRGLELMSTGICLSYNSLNGKLKFCNAGHPPMRIRKAGAETWEPLELAQQDGHWNLPMGVAADTKFSVGDAKLEPGDQLLLFTDGLLEAHNDKGKQFSDAMFAVQGLIASGLRPEDRANALLDAWTNHIGGARAAQDDLTFAILECQPYQKGNRYALFIQNNWLKKT